MVCGEESATAEELREYLRERLPSYMQVVGDKGDRGDAEDGEREGGQAAVAGEEEDWREEARGEKREASSEQERQMQEVWKEVLGVEEVGVDENFFELGGDSILSLQVVARARGEGVRVTPKQVFEQRR